MIKVCGIIIKYVSHKRVPYLELPNSCVVKLILVLPIFDEIDTPLDMRLEWKFEPSLDTPDYIFYIVINQTFYQNCT